MLTVVFPGRNSDRNAAAQKLKEIAAATSFTAAESSLSDLTESPSTVSERQGSYASTSSGGAGRSRRHSSIVDAQGRIWKEEVDKQCR